MPPPRGLVQSLDHHLHRRELLPRGARLLVACSGGADSVALLRLLHAVNQGRHWNWTLSVAHIDHALRGAASREDARFVKALAARLKLPFVHKRLTWKKSDRRPSEADLRTRRLAALSAMARKTDSIIVLGHHADDQAETVLMRILRGCGIHGLAGIPARGADGFEYVHPLLPFTRAQLRAYLAEIGQPWREDATNASPDYLRNRIRLELLPLLETYQPGVRDSLQRLAEHAGEASDYFWGLYYTTLFSAAQNGWLRTTDDGCEIRRDLKPSLVRPLIGRFIQRCLKSLGASLDAIDFDQMREAIDAIDRWQSGKRLQFPGGIMMRIERDRVFFWRDPLSLRRQLRHHARGRGAKAHARTHKPETGSGDQDLTADGGGSGEP